MGWDEYAERYRQVDHLAEELPPLLVSALESERGRFLDVGCGEGFLLDRVRRDRPAWDLNGFEVSRVRADLAASKGHRVVVDPEGVIPVTMGTFDVVACCHVIEHVPDDFEYATVLATLVKPGGYLYVETPLKLRGAWYFRRSAQAGWVLDPTHLREYRSTSAALAPLRAAGLELVDEAVDPIRLSLASAENLVRRVLRRPIRSSPGQPAGWRAWHVTLPRYRIQAMLVRKPAQ